MDAKLRGFVDAMVNSAHWEPCPICGAMSNAGGILGQYVWHCPEHGIVWKGKHGEYSRTESGESVAAQE